VQEAGPARDQRTEGGDGRGAAESGGTAGAPPIPSRTISRTVSQIAIAVVDEATADAVRPTAEAAPPGSRAGATGTDTAGLPRGEGKGVFEERSACSGHPCPGRPICAGERCSGA
jgi:hypothetical protein